MFQGETLQYNLNCITNEAIFSCENIASQLGWSFKAENWGCRLLFSASEVNNFNYLPSEKTRTLRPAES